MPLAARILVAGAILALAMTVALTLAATPPPVTSERQGLTTNDQ